MSDKSYKVNVIDIPVIQDTVSKKHSEFLSKYSMEIDKVVAEQILLADRAFSKIYRLLLTFKETGIIDEVVINDGEPLKSARIIKNGLDNYIDVVTNGKSVVFEGHSHILSDLMAMNPPHIQVDDISENEYDWMDFSLSLLDYIHDIIYERKSACETKVLHVFEEQK